MTIATTASTSSIHQDTLNTQTKCGKCSYNHTKPSASATVLHMAETVLTVARKGTLPACTGDQENSPPRMSGFLDIKEVDLG